MSADKAKKCFENNLKHINAHDNPVEFNFNQGLAALTETIQDIEKQISEIHRKFIAVGIIK